MASNRWTTVVASFLLVSGALIAQAGAAPVDKKTFAGRPAMYLQFELTHTGAREFGVAPTQDGLRDAAWRFTKTVRFEVPLNMATPGAFPPSAGTPSVTEMGEEDRFIGWMATPDPDASEDAVGNPDPAKNPMFLPVSYSVDDVHRSRYRDSPDQGWGTQATTTKGTGTAYIPVSGMMICDLKKLVCDIANVAGGYNGGKDRLTVATSSDVPGFEPKTDQAAPDNYLPGISAALGKQLSGMSISLVDPITKTFTAPAPGPTGGPHPDGSTVTLKLTVSSKPAPKTAPAK
ncbi:MAG TPA: hypothetical protein VFC25_15035 [Verrucomicrobiae bacterium]|jgi:hypothetical protein|nr:hypothetical protein [Verrucomicrobiae bacterium]